MSVHVCGLGAGEDASRKRVRDEAAERQATRPSKTSKVAPVIPDGPPLALGLDTAASLARHLLFARRIVLCRPPETPGHGKRHLDDAAAHAQRLSSHPGSGGMARDTLSMIVAHCTEAATLLATSAQQVGVRAFGKPGASPSAQLHALTRIDDAFWRLVYLCLVALEQPALVLATSAPAAAAAASAGLADPSALADADPTLLLREPATFFLCSHTRRWAAKQRARWAEKQPACHGGARDGVAGHSRGWMGEAVASHLGLIAALGEDGGVDAAASRGRDGRDSRDGHNQLLWLWYARQLEAIALLDAGGVSDAREFDALLPPSARASRDEDAPAPPPVLSWRRADREWPCWVLAFAVPSPAAVELLVSRGGPYVELGCGTGYWASVLRTRGVRVAAFDARPPAREDLREDASRLDCSEDAAGNDYHKGVPPFGPIRRGGPRLLSHTKWAQHTLLLCYPPPRDPMALEALRRFSGDSFVHVGEWLGDTGTSAFEAELRASWQLEARVPLPNWADTFEDLSVWTRRRAAGAEENASACSPDRSAHPVLACNACGAPGRQAHEARAAPPPPRPSSSRTPAVRLLRRCRYCRLAVYCSAACAAGDAEAHARVHACRMISIQRPLDFSGRDYYDLRKPFVD